MLLIDVVLLYIRPVLFLDERGQRRRGVGNAVFMAEGCLYYLALGPPMFMHRPSALNNPDAPIGHHWQDASHKTRGVVTGGYSFGKFKIEASAFTGTEPDENRWAFDKLRLNSWSFFR